MQTVFLVFWTLLIFDVVSQKNIIVNDCGPNMIPTRCGNRCQKTCGQPEPENCSKSCVLNRCMCKPGYVRRDENGPCIPKSWCKIVALDWEWD